MAPRANWKGYLKTGELSCPVALFTAASTSERIAFHIVNARTMHRVHRRFVDSKTGKPVEAADQAKGYETDAHRYVLIEPDEIAAVIPEGDKTLQIETFIPCDSVDDLYFNRPYYLAPSGEAAGEAFAVLREGMRKQKVAAIARAVLFRRLRTLLLRPHEQGLIATTLCFDYEVLSPAAAFEDIPKTKLDGEMIDLAKHIIKTKAGRFDAKAFDDRYEKALAELVRAKVEGKPIRMRAPIKAREKTDLLTALRKSAGATPIAKTPPAKNAPAKRGGARATKKARDKRPALPRAS
jgi:DNA end-binding protein Ku